MRGALIHGVLLAVMLVYGYRTWTRDKTIEPSLGNIVLWDKTDADLVSIEYKSENKVVKLERRTDGSEPYWWGVETTITKKGEPGDLPLTPGLPGRPDPSKMPGVGPGPGAAPGAAPGAGAGSAAKPAETKPGTPAKPGESKPAESKPATPAKPAETKPGTPAKPAETKPATPTKPAETPKHSSLEPALGEAMGGGPRDPNGAGGGSGADKAAPAKMPPTPAPGAGAGSGAKAPPAKLPPTPAPTAGSGAKQPTAGAGDGSAAKAPTTGAGAGSATKTPTAGAGAGSGAGSAAGSGAGSAAGAGSGATAGSGAGSGSAAKKPPEEIRKTREFPLGEAGDKLIKGFTQARALRDLGVPTDEQKKDYKLNDAKTTLTITFKDGARTFLVGGSVYGGSDRYVIDQQSGRAYVLSKDLISGLEIGESSLHLMDARGFDVAKIESVTIEANGKTKTVARIQTGVEGQQVKTWGDPDTKKADQTVANFVDNTNNLRPVEYAPDLKIAQLTPVLKLTYRDQAGTQLGTLMLYKHEKPGALPEGQDLDMANPPKGETEYVIVTEKTRVPAIVRKDTAERTEQDIATVFSEHPTSVEPKGNPFGNTPVNPHAPPPPQPHGAPPPGGAAPNPLAPPAPGGASKSPAGMSPAPTAPAPGASKSPAGSSPAPTAAPKQPPAPPPATKQPAPPAH